MKKTSKGQALVEFVIILPIFIMLLLGFIDVGKIIYFQNKLENKITEVIDAYDNGDSLEAIKNDYKSETVDIKTINNKTEYVISTKIDIITPGLNLIIKSPYEIVAKKVVYNE